ncbi:MAG: T9SS type A sorting domain-containing protein [Saprospiraceae bacterium]
MEEKITKAFSLKFLAFESDRVKFYRICTIYYIIFKTGIVVGSSVTDLKYLKYNIMQKPLLCFILFQFLHFSTTSAQNFTVSLKEIKHACDTVGGILEYEILGDATGVTYKWSNGATDLRQVNLPPGNYELELDAGEGCRKIVVNEEIIKVVNPVLEIIKTEIDTCREFVKLKLSQFSSEIAIQDEWVLWSDQEQGKTERIIPKGMMSQICATVNIPNTGTCSTNLNSCENLTIPGCAKAPVTPKIILNEFSPRVADGQFIELLVIGDGICGNTTDIRGYFIQNPDHNPVILPSVDTIFPPSELYGCVQFSQNLNWIAVPNGSLITIYNDKLPNANMPPDDPFDIDGNGYYILGASQPNLLYSRISTSIFTDLDSYLDAWTSSGNWDYLQMKTPRGGIHILNPDISLSHGYEATNGYILGISSLPYIIAGVTDTLSGCGLKTGNYLEVSQYVCDSLDPTPGMANSIENRQLIEYLRSCTTINTLHDSLSNHQSSRNDLNSFLVFPNPAFGSIYYQVSSQTKGIASLEVFSAVGHRLKKIEFDSTAEPMSGHFQLEPGWSPGLYFIRCVYPDGKSEVRTQAIIK